MELSSLPQFLNQEPPRPQQLVSPDFLMVPHLGHEELPVCVVAAGVHTPLLVQHKGTRAQRHTRTYYWSQLSSDLGRVCVCVHSYELTFAADIHPLHPAVFHVFVSGSSTVFVPSTARSATTDSTRFLERAALRATHCVSNRGSDGWRADQRVSRCVHD